MPCLGGTWSASRSLVSAAGCLPVAPNFWAPTGSAAPIECPASGFFCPGAADVAAHAAANITPAGSQPIPLRVGSIASAPKLVIAQLPTVEMTLTLDADLDGYDNATLVADLARVYGVSAELIEVAGVRGGSVVLVVRIAEEDQAVLAARVAAVDSDALSAALGVSTTRAADVRFSIRNVTRYQIVEEGCTPGHWVSGRHSN